MYLPDSEKKPIVFSLLTISSQLNITRLNQGDNCTIVLCNTNEKIDSPNQPQEVCANSVFEYDSFLLLKAFINGWFGYCPGRDSFTIKYSP